MTSAGPDPWSSALPSSDPEARSALLRLQAEMFAGARGRDRETVEAFEAMTLGFLPRVDPATLAAVARLVAPCPDTPDSVLVALAQGSSEAQGLLAREAPRLPPEVVDLLLGTESGRPSLAARPDLDARTIGRLLVLNEDAVDLALAANPALDPTQSSFAVLIERARERPALAHALLTRRDLTLSDEAALYLHADAERRAEIRHRIAASALFHRSPAPRLRGRDAERLIALAREGDVPAFEDGLTAALRLPPATAWRLLESGRAELLALALAALGMDEEDAMRIFLTLHPALAHSVATVFALARVVRQVPRPIALALVEAVLGSMSDGTPTRGHLPGWDASGTPGRGSERTASGQGRAPAAERRHRAG
jgi:hypothetical protein